MAGGLPLHNMHLGGQVTSALRGPDAEPATSSNDKLFILDFYIIKLYYIKLNYIALN